MGDRYDVSAPHIIGRERGVGVAEREHTGKGRCWLPGRLPWACACGWGAGLTSLGQKEEEVELGRAASAVGQKEEKGRREKRLFIFF